MPTPAARWFIRPSTGLAVVALLVLRGPALPAEAQAPATSEPTYQQIRSFALTGGSAEVTNFVLKRDRVEMTLTGVIYFSAPVGDRVTGAVFIGQGTVRAEVPPSPNDFEKANVRRMLGADLVESDFKTAVLRMTDDTFDAINRARVRPEASAAPAAAQKLAAEFEPRLLMQTGINLSARLAGSILNGETPGVFFAEFDGGKRGRFDLVFDDQNRIPTANFGINGGEKGVFFTYQDAIFSTDVWMAFASTKDYDQQTQVYSDVNNLVDITHYDIDLDVRTPGTRLGFVARIDLQTRAAGVRAISFRVNEDLNTYQNARRDRQLHLKAARVGGQDVASAQEDWEGGFTVFLPAAVPAGSKLTVEVTLDGTFMQGSVIPECSYLVSNVSWLPRHGELDRATYDLTFHHQKRHLIASTGARVSEQPDASNKDLAVTKYRIAEPVAIAAFAVGPFERAKRMSSAAIAGGQAVPLEFNNVSRSVATINGEFMLGEMDNAVRFLAEKFGKYPYETLGAVIHPYGFGQGFPTLLLLAPADNRNLMDSSDPHAFVFISHETAHQWWGHIVQWRSYRDQWLSEGFAEYSGILYAAKRLPERPQASSDLFRELRDTLHASPRNAQGGLGKGRLADIGPIILGRRLNTSKSFGAYQALIYDKGALVLRMLHFLLSNPTTGDGQPFFTMMSDFVERHRNGSATTEEFMAVAGEHFARSPIGQKYGLRDLKWFFDQWVYQSDLPTYSVEYELQPQPDGAVLVDGTIRQDGVPATWSMPLPIVFSFAGNQQARTTVRAVGGSATFQIKLPAKPLKVELDPASWVLSDKTTIKAK